MPFQRWSAPALRRSDRAARRLSGTVDVPSRKAEKRLAADAWLAKWLKLRSDRPVVSRIASDGRMSGKRTTSDTATVTVRQAVFDLLRDLGMTTVFGNPGSTELPFLNDWPNDFRYILGLQEASVVAMADGYARATGNAAFCNLHSAVGIGHALGNVFSAFRNQTPLVITAGQQVRSLLPIQPFLWATNAAEFPKPYVKWSGEPARAEDVPAALAHAYHVAMQRPCGPTFVSIPIDDWEAQTRPMASRAVSRDVGPDPQMLDALVRALAAAERP